MNQVAMAPNACNTNKLLVQILDEVAQEDPDRLYGEIPSSPDTFADGYRKVSYRQLANGVNGMAHWIEANVGRSTTFETLVYFGPHDMRYIILVLAAVKTGFRMLFPSTRFATPAIVQIIQTIDSKTLLVAEPVDPVVDSLLEIHQMVKYQVPDLYTLLESQSGHYAYAKSFEEARGEPLLVLHTSGTTGFPKPIFWTNDWANSLAEELHLEPPEGFQSMSGLLLGSRVLSMFPRFHAAHLCCSLFFPLYKGTVAIYPLANHVPMVKSARDALRHTRADVAALIPPQLEELGKDEALLAEVTRAVKHITWGGGPITDQTGDKLCSKISIFNSLGATEMGIWPTIRRNDGRPDQWAYLRPHFAVNIIMEHRVGNVHEAVIHRNTEGYVQPVFQIHTTINEYPTGDLWVPHPDDPNLWKIYGRADDMLAFQTGEKFHPVDAEQFLLKHAEIEDAMLLGTGMTKGALPLSLASGVGLGQILDLIEQMNGRCPSYARISSDRIILVDQKRPLIKTGKGTISRRATTDIYQKEIDALPCCDQA
ncbi:acetyl-CoA synthetase-like protein [Lophiostoma macrostomum CBS 122681]|uniref:Acetyl-CoA synthetase-like protein n=1 Tax=Lophiostoma macrostomum CBS 122681 TaxID=1314788 RepID=A0A6A6SLP2_9PLEO|nr:acetyl-CoA synthetase-like protein [Lophiostoma macrostomum CBS 122681]